MSLYDFQMTFYLFLLYFQDFFLQNYGGPGGQPEPNFITKTGAGNYKILAWLEYMGRERSKERYKRDFTRNLFPQSTRCCRFAASTHQLDPNKRGSKPYAVITV